MTPEPLAISFDDVAAASERIAGRIHRTPVLRSRLLDEVAGRELFLKCENLQRGGSFKVRGATNRLLALSDDERQRGVVAFSSGNHAQAVALASRSLGVDAIIAMPLDAPRSKVDATVGYGARIVTYDRHREDREEVARAYVEREGRALVPPYDNPFVMAGQGTVGLELLAEVPELDAIVTPVGGGGLLAGVATAASGAAPGVRVFGAEPAAANDTALSLEAGERVTIAPPDTIADGARPQSPGHLTFPIVRDRSAGVVLVPDEELVTAMRLVLTRAKLLVEPTGALGLAAALFGRLPDDARRVGVVLSGGNLDLDFLITLSGAERA
jgi:threonine dehydratase